MKAVKIAGLLVSGMIVGAIVTSWLWWRVLSHQMASKSVEVAFRAAEEVEWLALLRLNEATNVMQQLENSINIGTVTLAQWEEAAALDEKSRRARDRFLVPVKVYRESYPARSEEAALINALLSKVPERNLQSVCKNGVCRLDDLRRGGGNR